METDTGHDAHAVSGFVPLRRIVVGVDFSRPSLAAAGWTMRHFAPRAECILVHALDVPKPSRFLPDMFPARGEIVASAQEGTLARLERLREEEGWGDARIEVRDGRPEVVITDLAREADADLVVAGEHLRPRGLATALGSTAEALVRSAPVPVLLARGASDHAPHRILVALDESEHARAALAWARTIAEQTGGQLTALHVFRPVYLGVARAVSGLETSRNLENEQLRQRQAWLAQCVTSAGCDPAKVSLRMESGEPAAGLVAAQRGGGYDLVVVGSRGAGGVSRMLLGSVATGILRGASCPVLVVRGQRPESAPNGGGLAQDDPGAN